MDSLDIRIVRDMLESKATSPLKPGFKRSYSSVARRLRVDENTVKNRIQRLYESGFLKGWWVAVNPTLVGQQMVQVWFDVKDQSKKQEVIEKVSLIPGVAVVKDLFGPSMGAVIYHGGEGELKRTTELISRIAESDGMTVVNEPFPHCGIALSADDLRIVRGLQRSPLKSYTDLGKELGLSARTIKRRLTRLSERDAVYMVGELDPKFFKGGIVSSLLVFYEGPEHRYSASREVLAHLGDKLLFAELDDAHHGYFVMVIDSVGEAKSVLKWALALPGVASGRVDLTQDIINLYGVYEEQLEKLQRASERAPRAKSAGRVRQVLAE